MKTMVILLGILLVLGCSRANREGRIDFSKRVLAKINGERLLRKEFEKREKVFRAIYGGDPSYEQALPEAKKQFQCKVLEKMIDEMLVAQEALKIDKVIDENIVEARLTNMRRSFGKGFDEHLKLIGTNEEEVKKEIRQGIQVEEWMNQKLPVNDLELETAYKESLDSLNRIQAKASHILISLKENATKEEKDSAIARLKSIRKKIAAGTSFEKMAEKYSSCPSAKHGGDLGFFKKGSMVPEFDSVAFSLETGKISGIVKTKFGYHLIKVIDKKEDTPLFDEVKIALERKIKLGKLQKVITKLRKKSDIIYYF